MTRPEKDAPMEASNAEPSQPAPAARLADRFATAFGVDPTSREATLTAMLDLHEREYATYWFQLVIALGIATLGLVLGSTAVVIGAMLISPLMGPIVHLGMALAVGSPVLTLRSAVRIGGSIVTVVASAALITLALPFHEITTEIAARTTPTALDLLVAVFCALAAAFVTARAKSDTASTAAGTSIGIALVPPLCVVGFGLGLRRWDIARGAALLFTANLCAIVLFAVLSFLVLGFGRLPVHQLEKQSFETEGNEPGSDRAIRWLQRAFGARYGWVLRVSMPLLLVVAVALPLRKALEEVAWEVRVRGAIATMLAETPRTQNAVRTLVTVERHAVDVRLVLVAPSEEAASLQESLRQRIAVVAQVLPVVSIVAVPDFASVATVVNSIERTRALAPVPSPTRAPDLTDVRALVDRALESAWPTSSGRILGWDLTFSSGSPRVELAHLGAPLGSASEGLLARVLSTESGLTLGVRDIAYTATAEADGLDGPGWLPSFARAVDAARAHRGLHLCVTQPATGPVVSEMLVVLGVVRAEIASLGPRGTLLSGDRWRFSLSEEPCAVPAVPSAAPEDAGSGTGG